MLRRLVEELPEIEVPAAVAELRLRNTPAADRPWPPAWFGAASGTHTDIAAHSEEVLEDGVRPVGVIVCDTGPLVAAALANDDDHHPCVELFTGLQLARRPLLLPATVVAEVGYLLGRQAGPRLSRSSLTRLRQVIWCAIVALACELTAWMQTLALHGHRHP